jgi:beta-galactosidase
MTMLRPAGAVVSSVGRARLRVLLLTAMLSSVGAAQQPSDVAIDATAQPAPVETGFLKFGTTHSPDGHTIDATSRYLRRDGKPWLPVMGEFHFSRYPEAEWDQELLEMKAGGVTIVSSYIIWIYHEEVEGKWDWSGQRNLRHFVQLCAKHGLLFYARPGPWVHAETRNGGFPDWLVARVGSRLRSNDSTYLASVGRLYGQVGQQLRGLLWKDGGPVIGVQLENEYNATGPGKGISHIVTLKTMARSAGLDVPLYSVTGWDNTVWPPAEVIPVFGAYPDMPWDAAITMLPANESYAFRFANRANGGFPARLPNGTLSPVAESSLTHYPNLGAEYGGAIQVTYHRRPVISGNDIGAMLPVQIGSGVNLYGYYMFHGGAHLIGARSTLMESQRTGYPTDVPVISYDFQAPLSQYGEMRESFRLIKPVHYFLQAFGEDLAPMVPHAPSVLPTGLSDTTTLRISARTLGNRGYVFFSNYLRGHHMAEQLVRVKLRLPGETVDVPSVPIKIASASYGIWPVNLQIGSSVLKYSTAQLVTRVGGAAPLYVFFAIPGVTPEFAFDTTGKPRVSAPGARVVREGGRVVVRDLHPGAGVAVTITATNGTSANIMLLTHEQAENLWLNKDGGADQLLLTPDQVFFDGSTIHLRTTDGPTFSVSAYPRLRVAAPLTRGSQDGLFVRYSATVPAHPVSVDVSKVRDAALIPPVPKFNAVTWRKEEIALAPTDSNFDKAALWRVGVKPQALTGVSNVFLDIQYIGDVARLSSGNELLDDDFFKGTHWRVGLRRMMPALARGPLELRVLPLRSDAPIFLQTEKIAFPSSGQIASVAKIVAVPEYEFVINGATAKP